MPRHLPMIEKIYTPDTPAAPALDNLGIRPLVIVAPCSCGNGHEWVVQIPPSEWRTVFYLGQLEAVDDDEAEPDGDFTETSQDPLA